MNKIQVPPIKSQGIKTKIVTHIIDTMKWNSTGTYIEPFMGTGVVGFNIKPKKALFFDTNPHLINFYQSLQNDKISSKIVREFLEEQGNILFHKGVEHYLYIRKRFNESFNPLDFLFLNRSCFNGMIRFNNSGLFNVPFCKKNNRFAKAYITKIVNQVEYVYQLIQDHEYYFQVQDFKDTFEKITISENDFVYCDPPYIDRYSSYYNNWTEADELILFELLKKVPCSFILSTWKNSPYRENKYITKLWNYFSIKDIDHFYHVGANENNRKMITEALIYNDKQLSNEKKEDNELKIELFIMELAK